MFTTHATLLGRYLASGNYPLYENINKKCIDVNLEAKNRDILPLHLLEKASVHLAHTFTTISEITAKECEYFFERRADFLTYNGLNHATIKNDQDNVIANLNRKSARRRLINFLKGFFPKYDIIPEKTFVAINAGRYEYRNKGFDIWIESLARLNHRIKELGLDITYVAILIAPAANKGYNYSTMASMAQARIQESYKTEMAEIISSRLRQKIVDITKLHNMPFTHQERLEIVTQARRSEMIAKKCGSAITTHCLVNDGIDPILCDLRRC